MYIDKKCHTCKVVVVKHSANEHPVYRVGFQPDPKAVECVSTLAGMFPHDWMFIAHASTYRISTIKVVKMLTSCDLRSCKEAVDNYINGTKHVDTNTPYIASDNVVVIPDASWIVRFVCE